MPRGRHRRPPARHPLASATILRGLAVALSAAVLLPCAVVFLAGVSLRATAANPAYVMGLIRTANVLAEVKDELFDGLVDNSGLGEKDRGSLRQALQEGIPVSWLDTQVERILTGLAGYLSSSEERLSIEVPVVELKVNLLDAIRDHMGDAFYLEAVRGFKDVPDYVDIGGSFNVAALRRARPVWRGVTLAPLVAGAAALVLSLLLWLAAGRGARGVAAAGGVWTAAGLVATAAGLALGALGRSLFGRVVPFSLPELGAVHLGDLAVAALNGVRAYLVAAGSGTVIAGVFAAALPRIEKERQGARR